MTSSPPNDENVIDQMQRHIARWNECGDGKALFLSCYCLMTGNVVAAVQRRNFNDPEWVDRLMHRFAEYYFVSLNTFEENAAGAPAVWQLAHSAANDLNLNVIQKLLAGVNAHINYDLVFALVDLLQSGWAGLSELQRTQRYEDYCRINAVIAQTIDSVQAQIIEPAMPVMNLIDTLMGRADERMISVLITHWRDGVWRHTVLLLDANDAAAADALCKQVEASALETGRLICT